MGFCSDMHAFLNCVAMELLGFFAASSSHLFCRILLQLYYVCSVYLLSRINLTNYYYLLCKNRISSRRVAIYG